MADSYIAMVALERPAGLQAGAVIGQLKRQSPSMSIEEAGGAPSSGGAFILKLDEVLVTVMQVDAPMPSGTLDQATTGNLLWADSAKALAAHRAHAIVASLRTPSDLPGRVAAASAVTQVCAAIAALSSAIGVYWIPSEAVYEAGQFQAAAQSPEGALPIELWVRLHFVANERQGQRPLIGCFTTGLASFVGREIEFQAAALPPPTVAERVLGTAQYLLSHGLVLKHGDTLGISSTERIRVEHVNEGQYIKTAALRLIVA